MEDIPAEQRRFCSVCQHVDETFKNYLLYFFTGQREKSAFCRNLFTSLFEGTEDPVAFMAQKCEDVLKAAGLQGCPAENERMQALSTVLENAMSDLAAQLPELALPLDFFKREIRESLPAGLARTIASYAVFLDVSAFKNERKRIETLQQLMKLYYAIWKIRPQDVAWQASIANGVQAFHAGEYQQAQALFEEAQQLLDQEDRRSNYATAAYADLLSYQAHMLMDGSGGERSFAKAYQFIQNACRITAMDGSAVTAPRRFYESAFFQLFHPQEWMQHSGQKADAAFVPLLEKAAAEGCVDALILLADLYLTGAHGCEALKDPAKGAALLGEGAARTDISQLERAKCELRLARHHFASSDVRTAELYYEKAAKLGSYQAVVHMREKHFSPEVQLEVNVPVQAQGKICCFNTSPEISDMNRVLRDSLPVEWEQRNGDIPRLLLDHPEILTYGQMIFAFLGNDERQNLLGALETLKVLNSVAWRQQDRARLALMDRVDLFVLVRQEASRMMIDAAMNQLAKDVYFRIHLCDPEMMAANELLQRCPTFLPCIDATGRVREERWKNQKKTERCQRRIVVLGTTECAFSVARQVIACTYLEEYPTQLTIVGPDAERMESRFREKCPGLFADGLTRHITPQFVKCDLEALPLCRTNEGEMGALHELLHQASYFVVTGDEDMDNVSLAVRLRTELIRAHLPQGTQAIIAVLYRDAATQWMASQISVGARGDAQRYHWTENYGLLLFGSSDAFRYERLMYSPQERLALAVHKSYYGLQTDQGQERETLKEYYRRSYNRDSSACLALGMIYHCFGMGVYHAQAEDYAMPDSNAVLGRLYRALQQDVEKAAAIEHSRWTGWCLSRGWTKPENDVLVAYMQMQNPKHHLEIGRLHPYLTGYEQLIHERDRLNELIAVYQHNRKELPDPRIANRELAQRIPAFLELGE